MSLPFTVKSLARIFKIHFKFSIFSTPIHQRLSINSTFNQVSLPIHFTSYSTFFKLKFYLFIFCIRNIHRSNNLRQSCSGSIKSNKNGPLSLTSSCEGSVSCISSSHQRFKFDIPNINLKVSNHYC